MDGWVSPAIRRLDFKDIPQHPKTINDAVWGSVELLPHEVVLLDSPLLQRLRGVRQLGLAHLVYPGAGYDRLEHSIGVLETARNILEALEKNAAYHVRYSNRADVSLPNVSDRDRLAICLGALLHDVGHGPFSHATEDFILLTHPKEFPEALKVLRETFSDVVKIAPAEQMAVLFVLSDAFSRLLNHPQFETGSSGKADLAESIAARMLGSSAYLGATYLSGVLSGPLDADKIDYMARDSHHAGLPLGLDTKRLVSKLVAIEVTSENAPNSVLKKRADEAGGRYYEIGLSRSGLAASEQMLMARVTLYERLYYHHKIRAAEGMLRTAVRQLTSARGYPLSLSEIYSQFSDDTILDLWAGRLSRDGKPSSVGGGASTAESIRERRLYHRALSFSSRFLSGLGTLSDKDRDETRAYQWNALQKSMESSSLAEEVAEDIRQKATTIAKRIPRLSEQAAALEESPIIVDLPSHRRVSKVDSSDVLVETRNGTVSVANFYFNAAKWAQAYGHQKQQGYVFCPKVALSLVAVAARLVFYERFGILMSREADVAPASSILNNDELALLTENVCSAEAIGALSSEQIRLLQVSESELSAVVPDSLKEADPSLVGRLSKELRDSIITGLPSSTHTAMLHALRGMLQVLVALSTSDPFASQTRPDEKKDLQSKVRDCLRSAQVKVREGEEVAAGETDLILEDLIVLENKVLSSLADPFGALSSAAQWQARRYSIALSQRVRFLVGAYPPADENALLPVSQRVRVRPAAGPEEGMEIHFLLPWGHSIPSKAKG